MKSSENRKAAKPVAVGVKVRKAPRKAVQSSGNNKTEQASNTNSVLYWLGYSAKEAGKMQTDLDVVQLGRDGISRLAVENLAAHLGISKKTFAEEVLAISVRTLERKDKKEKLDRRISSQAVEIAKVAQHAFAVFESEERLKRWMNAPLAVIANNRPVDMLDTLSGINLVHQLLTRIEEGVYS